MFEVMFSLARFDNSPFHTSVMTAPGTFRTSSKLQAFDSLSQFRLLILHVTHRA